MTAITTGSNANHPVTPMIVEKRASNASRSCAQPPAGVPTQAAAPSVSIRAAHVQPGRDEQRGEDREDDRAEKHFGALLTPSDPGHDATSWSGCCR